MRKLLLVFFGVVVFWFVPQYVFAATLYLNPSSSSAAVGTTFTVSVRTNTQGSAVNAAEAHIGYSTETLELVSVKAGSTFYLTTPGAPSKGSGSAFFSGGVPSPGYTGGGGVLGTMTFRAKAAGTGNISITSGKVLLNDGLGTDALSGSSGSTYAIAGSTPAVTTNPTTTASPSTGSIEVHSNSHSDSNSWYAKNEVKLSWSRPSGAYGFSFAFDQVPDTNPDSVLDTTITTNKTYTNVKDGTWYFHIKSRGQAASSAFGPLTNFKVQVDTTAPTEPVVHLVKELGLDFTSTDALSGIASYTVALDDSTVKEKASSPYTLEHVGEGAHTITVIAYDKAGNASQAKLPLTVAPSKFKIHVAVPWTTILLLLNLLVMLVIAILLWRLLRKKNGDDKSAMVALHLASIRSEFDKNIESLKQHIDSRLVTLAKSAPEQFNPDNAVAEIATTISKAKTKIDKKISSLATKPKKK